ncbi:speckle-type POZ protein B-like [Microplitis mediator]|uniref:speckle-type POZ protein B-like n=1 Tax=Microplitis mediator TaxID=375433 RepID=UPI00255652DF|nr:speckle-type POZ protein B-like [Microplitis mediator]
MEILGYSHSKKHKVIYKWEINEIVAFIESTKNNKETVKLNSPTFTYLCHETEHSWYLQLRLLEEKEWISLYLHRHGGKDRVRIRYSLFLLNNKNEKKSLSFSYANRDVNSNAGFPKFLEIKQLLENEDDFLLNNTFTVCIELTVYDDYESFLTKIPLETPQRKITDDLKELYDSKMNSDVILVVGNVKFKAHKTILSARSPVFLAMFTHEMKEKKDSEVAIPDIDPGTFNKMLEFIYTDKINELDTYAAYLLEAADKYQLLNLKSLCEESLSKSASIDSAIKLMILADMHNANHLFEHVLELIIKNIEDVIKTPEYKALEKSKPFLLSKLIEKLATSMKSNASENEK